MITNIKKILIVRTDKIGDVVLTLPLAEIIREKIPDCEIDFLVNSYTKTIPESNPFINNVLSIKKESINEILNVLKNRSYDAVVIVRPTFIVALSLYLSKIKKRIGTGYRWYSFLFNLKHYQHRKYANKHELEYNLDLLKELGIYSEKTYTPKIIVKGEYVNEMLNKHSEITNDYLSGNYIIIHPFTKDSALKWKPEKFEELIFKLLSDNRFKLKIFITGTKNDINENKKIIESVEKNSNVKVFSDLELSELIALISKARLFISNSTGPLHIAAALNIYVIGIYSSILVESPVRWGPYTDKKKIFVPVVSENVAITAQNQQLMEQITVEQVYNSVINFIIPIK